MSILIHNCTAVLMDEAGTVLPNAYVVVEGTKIRSVSTQRPWGSFEEQIDGRGNVLMPGFVNAHSHVPMTAMRGYGDGNNLQDWLHNYIFPVEARDRTECLRLQIERHAGDHRLARIIVEQFMDELAENGYGAISRKTGASEALVREECDLIRSLNPRPGTGFSRRENLSYVTPDVLVLPGEDEELEVQVNGGGLPPLDLSVYYSNLLLETPDEEVRLYLSEKLNQARSIVENINGRQALLERCAKKIVAEQEEFFRKGHGYLRPLELQQAADALGVSKEWIRCAVKDKYLQCPQGIYPMSWFFTRESMSDE